jgi:hypothetical protein
VRRQFSAVSLRQIQRQFLKLLQRRHAVTVNALARFGKLGQARIKLTCFQIG